MKSLLVCCGLLLLPCLDGLAQSSVIFANDSSTLIRLPGGEGLPTAAAGGTYRVELIYAPAGTPDEDFPYMAIRLGASVSISTAAGRFNGGGRTAPTAQPGTNGRYQVRAWDSAYGGSIEEALSTGIGGLIGASRIFDVIGGNPTTTPPGTPTPIVGHGFTGFTMCPAGDGLNCPEPSTLVLAVLGASALVLLRRSRTRE
jgi:hypothetical protein